MTKAIKKGKIRSNMKLTTFVSFKDTKNIKYVIKINNNTYINFFIFSIISVLTLASTVLPGMIDVKNYMFPLIVAGIGVIASVLSVIFIRMRDWNNPHKALNIATYFATGVVVVGSLFVSIFYISHF